MKTRNIIDIELLEQLSPEAQADVLHYARLLSSVNGAKSTEETPEQKAEKQAATKKAAAEQARQNEENRQALQAIRRYIEKTEIPSEIQSRYIMRCSEISALLSFDLPVDRIFLTFEFGLAKGYRAGTRNARICK